MTCACPPHDSRPGCFAVHRSPASLAPSIRRAHELDGLRYLAGAVLAGALAACLLPLAAIALLGFAVRALRA